MFHLVFVYIEMNRALLSVVLVFEAEQSSRMLYSYTSDHSTNAFLQGFHL